MLAVQRARIERESETTTAAAAALAGERAALLTLRAEVWGVSLALWRVWGAMRRARTGDGGLGGGR